MQLHCVSRWNVYIEHHSSEVMLKQTYMLWRRVIWQTITWRGPLWTSSGLKLLNFSALKMEISGSSKTSVPISQSVRRHIPKGRNVCCDWLVKKQAARSWMKLDFAPGVRIKSVTCLAQQRGSVCSWHCVARFMSVELEMIWKKPVVARCNHHGGTEEKYKKLQ